MQKKLILCLCLIIGIILAGCNTSPEVQVNEEEPDPGPVETQLEEELETTEANEELNHHDVDIEDKPETVEEPKESEEEQVVVEKTEPEAAASKQPTKTEKATEKKQQQTKQQEKPKEKKKEKPKEEVVKEQQKAKKEKPVAKVETPEKNTKKKVEEPVEKQEKKEKKPSISNLSFVDQVIALTNVEREKVGVAALSKDAILMTSAQAKSTDMRENNYFDHTSPTYGGLGGILTHFNISYSAAAENIANGYGSPEAVVNGWMNSPGHKTNLLNGTYTHIGVGYDGNYWTQQFIKK